MTWIQLPRLALGMGRVDQCSDICGDIDAWCRDIGVWCGVSGDVGDCEVDNNSADV